MKETRMLTIAVTSVVLLTLIIGCNQETKASEKAGTSKSATVEELGQMNRDFGKALTAKDAVAAAMLYDENASILPPNEPIVTGRANIQA